VAVEHYHRCPGESRDPSLNAHNVLRLSAREQTTRHPVYRIDLGPRPAGVGAQAESDPWIHSKIGVDRLVWFERHDSLEAAMQREKRIKSWKRAWKVELIEQDNPHWIDLYSNISS
jgi:hypothetical protein